MNHMELWPKLLYIGLKEFIETYKNAYDSLNKYIL